MRLEAFPMAPSFRPQLSLGSKQFLGSPSDQGFQFRLVQGLAFKAGTPWTRQTSCLALLLACLRLSSSLSAFGTGVSSTPKTSAMAATWATAQIELPLARTRSFGGVEAMHRRTKAPKCVSGYGFEAMSRHTSSSDSAFNYVVLMAHLCERTPLK